ncbi:hypothetical protein [Paenibacillus sp. Marseille-Q4541]|uniref:hypothetical protein n=1 Tax=Paenibacillus sp. Marseille-Q4541 TaxID=2831522 RepID=UPI001BADC905|nr:hypothetical protein [Paenibacillus sp. Marseille-Q4541]
MARRSRASKANVQITGLEDLNELERRLKPLTEKVVRVGMQGDAELAMIAGVHEYGSEKMNIPARPFISTGKKKSRSAINKEVKSGVTKIAFGRMRAEMLFRNIGKIGFVKTYKNFQRIKQPLLSAQYVKDKEGNKLLQRDQDLLESLTWDIVAKGKE